MKTSGKIKYFFLILLGVCFVQILATHDVISATILQDNFDSGYTIINNHSSLNALSTEFRNHGWDGCWWDGNSYLEVSSTRSHSGLYSIKHAYYANQDRATLYVDDLSNRDELYVSYYIYFESDYWMGWSTSGGEQKFGRYFDTAGHTGNVLLSQHLYPNGRLGAGVRMNWVLTTAGGQVLAQGYDFSRHRGQWLHIEYYFKLNTPGIRNGIIRMWINGVKQKMYETGTNRAPGETILEVADDSFIIRTSSSQHFNSFWLFSLNNGTPTPSPQVLYLDDVLVTDVLPADRSTEPTTPIPNAPTGLKIVQ